MNDVGDLGRRIAERRRELGMSEELLAERAGMNRAYLISLEHSPSPHPSGAALRRLAVALGTTVQGITGGGALRPPGQARPQGPPQFEALEPKACGDLIADGGVGRFVFSSERGPVALPVNFAVLDGDVVFKTAPGTSIEQGVADGAASFEVDHLDEALAEGWSVLVSGRARVLTDRRELARAAALEIDTWAGEDRDVYVRLETAEVTGRLIRRRS